MRAILLLAIWFLAIHVFAAEQSLTATYDAQNSVTVYTSPCESAEVLKHIEARFRGKFQRADLTYQGKEFKACWALANDGNVYVVDELGEVSKVPAGAFQPDPPVSRM